MSKAGKKKSPRNKTFGEVSKFFGFKIIDYEKVGSMIHFTKTPVIDINKKFDELTPESLACSYFKLCAIVKKQEDREKKYEDKIKELSCKIINLKYYLDERNLHDIKKCITPEDLKIHTEME